MGFRAISEGSAMFAQVSPPLANNVRFCLPRPVVELAKFTETRTRTEPDFIASNIIGFEKEIEVSRQPPSDLVQLRVQSLPRIDGAQAIRRVL
jgi:hypothetical protein